MVELQIWHMQERQGQDVALTAGKSNERVPLSLGCGHVEKSIANLLPSNMQTFSHHTPPGSGISSANRGPAKGDVMPL